MENYVWLIPIFGYILGSFLPADYIVRNLLHSSPSDFGENYGTAATWRLVGPLPSLAVFVYDFAKGFLPVFVADRLSVSPVVLVLAAATPVLGHCWPVQRGFRGGRGMAASIGAVVYLAPKFFVPSFLAGSIVALYRRRTPWVGIIGFPMGLILSLYFNLPRVRLIAVFVVSVLLFVRQLQWGDWS